MSPDSPCTNSDFSYGLGRWFSNYLRPWPSVKHSGTLPAHVLGWQREIEPNLPEDPFEGNGIPRTGKIQWEMNRGVIDTNVSASLVATDNKCRFWPVIRSTLSRELVIVMSREPLPNSTPLQQYRENKFSSAPISFSIALSWQRNSLLTLDSFVISISDA